MTLEQLIAELSSQLFPDRLAENWKANFKSYVKEGLCDLQRIIKCLQEKHTDVYPQPSTYFKCGTTVICAPPGQIKRVYTIPTDDWCQPIQYPRKPLSDIQCWSRRFSRTSGIPDNTGLPILGQGYKFPESSTDGRFGRAQTGYWAYDEQNKNIIVAPWIQSTESVVIEWSGLKLSWKDIDGVSAGQMNEDEWKRAIKAWVMSKYNKFALGDQVASASMMEEYTDSLRMLTYDCRRIQVNLDPTYACPADGPASRYAELLVQQASGTVPGVPVAEVADTIAVIGDYGLAGDNEAAVAQLIKGWQPSCVVTTGDNNYPDGAADTIDANIGQYYRTFILDYQGAFPLGPGESDAVVNRFWPSLGNHDLDALPFPPAPFFDYFQALANKRNYTFIQGLCEFFVIDSGFLTNDTLIEPLGNTSVSVQAAWLQAKMAASVAKYKVVILHHSPYMSASSYNPGITALRWPFKLFGADLVLGGHGHNLERLVIDGLTYVVNGAGGAALVGFGAPVAGSEFRYNAMHGAVQLSVLCAGLTVSFYNTDGVLLDQSTITNQNPVLNTA